MAHTASEKTPEELLSKRVVLTTLSQLSEASKYFQTVFSNPVRARKLRLVQDRTGKDYRREDKWLDEVITDV